MRSITLLHFLTFALAVFVFSLAGVSAEISPLVKSIQQARPGAVIQLPAETLDLGDIVIPDGVTVKGAGYDKTIIDASSARNGMVIEGKKKVIISDLTIRGAQESGIIVKQAGNVTLARMKVLNNLIGVQVANSTGVRIENVILAGNRSSASLSHDTDSALVNCTVVNSGSTALTLSNLSRTAVFNNLVVNAPTAVYCAGTNDRLTLDHNLYISNYIGKMEGETTRATLDGWRTLSGFDRHSVVLPVHFTAAENGDYRPDLPLDWAPVRTTASDWGIEQLGGVKAPAQDIDGKKRSGTPDLGAFEVTLTARPADGSFTVAGGQGVTSAGLYTPEGIQIAVLFQNMPLCKGTYRFWLPNCDLQGQRISAGKYEVRLAESDLSNEYLGLIGSGAYSAQQKDAFSWAEAMYAFDGKGRIFLAQGWNENHEGVRSYDADYKENRWIMMGDDRPSGIATDNKYLYLSNQLFGKESTTMLRRFDLDSGMVVPFAPGVSSMTFTTLANPGGLAVLNGTLYLADTGKNKIFYGPAANPDMAQSFDVPSPRCLSADARTNLLWVISNGQKLLALDPATGTVKYEATPVAQPQGLAVNNGRMAVLSPATGKVHLFDCSDPVNLKLLRTIGTGDGPFGPIKADRFWFQQAAFRQGSTKTWVALSTQGDVMVVDGIRVSYWNTDGTLKRAGMGFWGQHNKRARFAGDDDVRCWSLQGDYSVKLDSKNGRWTPDTFWQLPALKYPGRSPVGFYTYQGHNYGTYQIDGVNGLDARGGYVILEMVDGKGIIQTAYTAVKGKGVVMLQDSNGDGTLDDKDTAVPVLRADGKPFGFPGTRQAQVDVQGNLVLAGDHGNASLGTTYLLTEIQGHLGYDLTHPVNIPAFVDKDVNLISPYDYKTKERLNQWIVGQLAPMSDGGYAANITLKTSGGTGICNGMGTDIAGFSKDGRFRWFHKFNFVKGSEGVQSIPECKLVMGMETEQCNYHILDEDGLGLGVLGMPQAAHWGGMWSDHPDQQQAWVGNDGKPYYLLGDYTLNGHHWFRINGLGSIKHQRVAVTINDQTAATLAALPVMPPAPPTAPPTPKVTIRKLAQPFPIDGDLKKWRAAGITPVLVTPESGSADIKGAQDCSAVIRLAYQGNDLYVQTIVFDDIITFHQPDSKMWLMDGIEMAINSYFEGFKFNVAITNNDQPTVMRDKAFRQAANRNFTPTEVPRVINILDNARDVEERKLIEAIYGIDLSNSKVIVTEFKLPLTAEVAFADKPANLPVVESGKTFWIGFNINDNDIPGSDMYKWLAWPATYGAFAMKEAGTLATFE